MIVFRQWRRIQLVTPTVKGEEYRREHIYSGWFLCGVIPLFIVRKTTWTYLA